MLTVIILCSLLYPSIRQIIKVFVFVLFLTLIMYSILKKQFLKMERLDQLKSDDLMRFFNCKIFGSETMMAEEKMRPQLWSTCLEFWKKAILYYMPNRLIRRAMTDQEFTKIKGLFFQLEEEEKHVVVKYGVSPQMNFLFHLMVW